MLPHDPMRACLQVYPPGCCRNGAAISTAASAPKQRAAKAGTPPAQSKAAAKHAAAHTYDRAHERWDKFDVDAALAEASGVVPEPSPAAPDVSELGCSHANGSAPSTSNGTALADADLRAVSTRRTPGGGGGGSGGVQLRSTGGELSGADMAAVSTRRAPPALPAYPPVRGSVPASRATVGKGDNEGEWRAKGNEEFKAGRHEAAVEAYTR